jgi:hypothetical protein
VRGLPFGLVLPAYGLFSYHRNSGVVDLRVHNGNRLSHHQRQVQLHGALDLCLLRGGDIFPDDLRRALHSLGGELQIGQEFQLLAPVIERGRRADDCLHAAHPGENSVFSMSSSTSAGNCPWWQCGHR